jgi:hypothetical protein
MEKGEGFVVEIWEQQVRSRAGGAWTADGWTLVKTGEPICPPEEYSLPPELEGHYCWSSNWKLVTAEKDEASDAEGWSYASRSVRFSSPDRKSKVEAGWNDGARRRLWARTVRKEFCAGSGVARLGGVDMSRLIPRMQEGLQKINEARKRIQTIMQQAPQAAQSEQMLSNVMCVRKSIADLTSILDQLERAQGPGSTHIAHIKKLRREVVKEEIKIEEALGTPSSSSSSSQRFPPLRRTGSGGSSGGGSGKFPSQLASSAPSSSSSIHKSGSSDSLGSAASSDRHSVKSGKGSFTPSGPGCGSMGGLGEDGSLSLDEGLFVDQTMHERLIMQRLQPVNESEVLSEIVQERNQEIGKLHRGIVEINEMFVDLSRIVGEQGLVIDSIWINIDEGNAKTKEGLVNIAKAASLQSRGNCVIS